MTLRTLRRLACVVMCLCAWQLQAQSLDVISAQQTRPGQVIVGFAAETGDASGTVLQHAQAKLARKGCDLLVVNDVSGGAVFGSPDNEAVILSASGEPVEVPHGSKATVAHAIWDQVAARFQE